jgi:putative tricarboxylic transport membrane protein
MIQGVRVGPLLLQNHPDLFWGVATSMYVGNIMLLILNLPLIPLWVKLLKVPYHLMFPIILLLCVIGVYSVSNNLFDIIIMNVFGVIGYFMRKYRYEPAPLILGLILCPILENAFRQTMIISKGSFTIFFMRPISAAFLVVAIATLVIPPLMRFVRRMYTKT